MAHEIQCRDLFLLYHKPNITALIVESSNTLIRDPAGVIADYVTGQEDCFGAKEFERYFGVTPLNSRELPFTQEFYDFWHGNDPVCPAFQRCETHHLPVLRPERYSNQGRMCPYSFKNLSYLMSHPKEGPASKLNEFATLPGQFVRTYEKLAWVVARKGVINRNVDYFDQNHAIEHWNGSYEPRPDALDLATICAAEYVRSNKRYLGDQTGEEKCLTYSSCKGSSYSGWITSFVMVGGFSLDGLDVTVSYETEQERMGIAALRKF